RDGGVQRRTEEGRAAGLRRPGRLHARIRLENPARAPLGAARPDGGAQERDRRHQRLDPPHRARHRRRGAGERGDYRPRPRARAPAPVLVLTNDEVARLLGIEDCMAALEPMYRDLANGQTLLSPRVDNIAPTAHPGGYYGFKHMGGTWPARKIQALRINSDVVTHPLVAGKPRRVKQPLAPGRDGKGRWVGLVLLFSTETGALLAMFPDGVMQRLRVGSASGLALKHLAREDVSTLALIGTGWQAGAQLMAARAVRRFRKVRVFSPRAESRAAFAAQHENIELVDTLEACVEGADVILAATSSLVRVIEPQWLRPGMHIGCIKLQEID